MVWKNPVFIGIPFWICVFLLSASCTDGCCVKRESDLRSALVPYVQAMKQYYRSEKTCPKDLDELNVQTPAGMTRNQDELLGLGGHATYLRSADGTCAISMGGFAFCGICRWDVKNERESCYH